MIDTHAHLNFQAFADDYRETAQRAHENGVQFITVGTNLKTSQRAIEIAEEIGSGVWAAIGLHPIHLAKNIEEHDTFNGADYRFVTKAERFDKRPFFELAQRPRVVAVGESGLDYFHLDDFRAATMTREEFVELQKETLYEILGFAREIQKPNIFHCRDAYDDFVDIVKDFGYINGVVHCFTGTKEQAVKILELGLSIGFTGIVTFPNAQALQEVATFVPLDRLLLETDCPYLAPQPVRGKRNEPRYVAYVAEKIAKLKGCSVEAVAHQTTANATRLFKLF